MSLIGRSFQIAKNVRVFSNMRMLSSNSDAFAAAKEKLNTLTDEPDNQVKLKMYGLFKQATIGPCNAKKPGMLDIVGKAKWGAWDTLGQMSQDEAMRLYALQVDELVAASGGSDASPQSNPDDFIVKEKVGKVYTIRLNRPSKKNALTPAMYDSIREGLEESAKDPGVRVTVLTGTGDYYSSGNDLSNFGAISPADIPRIAKESRDLLEKFVGSFIDHPKPLVALINGPAVGITVTVLGLCDFVLASDKASFHTPFPQVGQTPEGCSSYVFPRIMGMTRAYEMLLGRKLTAQEAQVRNLVTEIFPHDKLEASAWAHIKNLADMPPNCVAQSKALIRGNIREDLHRVNKEECALLEKVWQSEECMNQIMKFFMKKQSKM